MTGRELLDLIAQYVSTKNNAEMHAEFLDEGEADAQLDKIAAAFEVGLNSR